MNCCFSSKHREQVSVPAGATFEYHCELFLKTPGPFNGVIQIVLDDNGPRLVTVRVTGTVKGEIPDAPPQE